MPQKYSIKDLELLSGIKAHTLRIWEQRYGILVPERTDTNIRYYNNADLRKLLNISVLNKNGHKISTIAHLSDELISRQAGIYLEDYIGAEGNGIESLYLALLVFDEAKFERILNTSIANLGFERTVERLMFPFLKHLGNLWQTGTISPAQEHYSSNIIRQKLITQIDKTEIQTTGKPQTILCFLPEGELHELGLLYVSYLSKIRGYRTIYLGQSVPMEDLINITSDLNPHTLVTILTTEKNETDTNTWLKACEEKLRFNQFLVSGRLVLEKQRKVKMPSSKFKIFGDFPDFKTFI